MGIGFMITILLLAALLGLFSKQVLQSDASRHSTARFDAEEADFVEDTTMEEYTALHNNDAGHPPHAM